MSLCLEYATVSSNWVTAGCHVTAISRVSIQDMMSSLYDIKMTEIAVQIQKQMLKDSGKFGVLRGQEMSCLNHMSRRLRVILHYHVPRCQGAGAAGLPINEKLEDAPP